MKIILINTPAPFCDEPAMNPPLGLCLISAVLKVNGYTDIVGLDLKTYNRYNYYDNDDFLNEIPLNGDIYGISMVSCELFWGKKIVKHIKKHSPNAKIVVGGPHANVEPIEVLSIPEVDMIVQGDGELAFLDIVNGKELSDIEGVSYKDKDVINLRPPTYITNLDGLPIPDRDIFDINRYMRKLNDKKAIHILTMRGCPFRCRFCAQGAEGKKVRLRSIENVMQEIDYIINKYGIKSFLIYDDTFTTNHKRVKLFCKEFRKRNIVWRCWSRTDTLTENLLVTMKNSGLSSMTFGIESGDDTILQTIDKKTTVEKHKQALLLCKKLDIPMRISLIYGLPGETKESLQKTIDFIKVTQPKEWFVFIFSPTCGSEFWNSPEKYGFWFDKQKVKNSDYIDTNFAGESGMGKIWIKLNTMTQDEMTNNLNWFISELDRVCPRHIVQDTSQHILLNKVV